MNALVIPWLSTLLLRVFLWNIDEHQCTAALARLEVLRACLLKQRLRLRPLVSLLAYVPSSHVSSYRATHFFMACLVLKACSFCVAGLMISSDGETNFGSLHILLAMHSWTQNICRELTARHQGATAELDGGSRDS
jgi:hypothetical protein